MSPSYQTDNTTTEQDVLVNPSKMEPSSARTMWKKVAFAMVVGGAVVVGNSYGSPMNTPTTEIEAFLSSVSDLKCEEGVSTMYSVFIDNGNNFPGEKVCGQLCATPKTAQFIFPFAPPPKPEKGDCASFGYSVDTGKFFDLGFAKASIFKRPKPYIEFKNRRGSDAIGCRPSQEAVEDFCNSNLDCMGYSFYQGRWCAKSNSNEGPFVRDAVFFKKPQQ
mmetsp:Transcript_12562/g.12330  ORF Transcript_12562/g.12330 Transcript_12562/m.12330 type:complete len:219 (-) Transcript_12562:82-738(-)